MITIQILVKNNEHTIKKTLDSLKEIDANILIGDLGSTDNSLEICKKYKNVEIIKLNFNQNYSKLRNELIREGFNFYIEPWEIVIKGHDSISNCKKNTGLYVLQNNIISKEIRIWENLEFKNPVFETLVDKNAHYDQNIVLLSKNKPDNSKESEEICKKWVDSYPLNSEPYYYLSCCYLTNRKYKEFKNMAEKYLIMEKNKGESSVMLNYYLAQIELHNGNLENSLKKILSCVILNPTLAEFWCLLGDLFYKKEKYNKAIEMYNNAITIGKRRISSDSYPIEIKKYQEYPNQMKNNCYSFIFKKDN